MAGTARRSRKRLANLKKGYPLRKKVQAGAKMTTGTVVRKRQPKTRIKPTTGFSQPSSLVAQKPPKDRRKK